MVSVNDRARRVEARSKPMQQALMRWFRRYALVLTKETLAEISGKSIAQLKIQHAAQRAPIKKSKQSDLERDLRRIFEVYGSRSIEDNADVGGTFIQDYMDAKVPLLQRIADGSRDAVREKTGDIIAEALREKPTPSVGEIARRIRTTMLGEGGGTITGTRDASTTTGQTTALSTGGTGELYVFSSERAATIARTEIAQAENTGIFEGYKASGVSELEWLSHKGPYPSGAKRGPFDRHHDRMHGLRVKLGEYFVTPNGNRLRYPADPEGPIEETINCRCTVRAIVR